MSLSPGSRPFFTRITARLFHENISQSQVDGVNTILAAWDKVSVSAPDLRFVACSMGNCFHETMEAMQPVREIGYGRGHAYGHPVGPWHQVYYGRGDIQETWYRNYQFANQKLHEAGLLASNESLVQTPDLMLRPDVSAYTLIVGMRDGWFTGHKLSDYSIGTPAHAWSEIELGGFDWVNSRRIVNGLDHASVIAGYGREFYQALILKE